MYPISVVARKTGLTPEVLRAWERRYHGVRPERDGRGRRMYSRKLLERLSLIARLLNAGYRPGDVVDLPDGRLVELVEEVDAVDVSPQDGVADDEEWTDGREAVEPAVQAALACDSVAFHGVAQEALTGLGRLAMADEFLFPVMRRMRWLRATGRCGDVHVTFARTNLRILVAGFLTAPTTGSAKGKSDAAPSVILATPPGFATDLGMLAAAVHVQAAGCIPIVLGAEVRGEDVVHVAGTRAPQAVVISFVTESYDVSLYRELSLVRNGLPGEVPVFFGGRLPDRLASDLIDAGLARLSTMSHLRQTLSEITLRN